MSGASNELDVGGDSDRMSRTPARHGIASLDLVSVRRVVLIADTDLIRLRPDDFYEPPTAPAGRVGGVELGVNYPRLPDYTFLHFSFSMHLNNIFVRK
jgi:hypothetical protein